MNERDIEKLYKEEEYIKKIEKKYDVENNAAKNISVAIMTKNGLTCIYCRGPFEHPGQNYWLCLCGVAYNIEVIKTTPWETKKIEKFTFNP